MGNCTLPYVYLFLFLFLLTAFITNGWNPVLRKVELSCEILALSPCKYLNALVRWLELSWVAGCACNWCPEHLHTAIGRRGPMPRGDGRTTDAAVVHAPRIDRVRVWNCVISATLPSHSGAHAAPETPAAPLLTSPTEAKESRQISQRFCTIRAFVQCRSAGNALLQTNNASQSFSRGAGNYEDDINHLLIY